MTGIAIGAVRTGRALTEAMRESGLRWLAEAWGDHGPERHQLLAGWAHPSLSGERLTGLWDDYRETLNTLDGVSEHREDWRHVRPEAGCWSRAVELLGDRVAELEYVLIHGESGEQER